jgi:hypothetical protein
MLQRQRDDVANVTLQHQRVGEDEERASACSSAAHRNCPASLAGLIISYCAAASDKPLAENFRRAPLVMATKAFLYVVHPAHHRRPPFATRCIAERFHSEDAVFVRYTPQECLYAAYPSM